MGLVRHTLRRRNAARTEISRLACVILRAYQGRLAINA